MKTKSWAQNVKIDQLREQHRQIADLSEDMLRAVAVDQPRPVSALRWRLARQLFAHLAMEDGIFYPMMARCRDPQLMQTARDFQAEMGGLASDFKAYMAGWSDARIAGEWPEFCVQTRAIIARMHRRMEREDRILYPLAECYAATPVDTLRKSG
mgnify:CR=1 FL=1